MSHEARTEILTGGAKALLAINGGGIVALLGFLSQLVPPENKSAEAFASITILGIGALAGGLIVAAANFYFRFWASQSWDSNQKEHHQLAYRFEWASVFVSFLFFIVGVLILVVGLYSLLNHGT